MGGRGVRWREPGTVEEALLLLPKKIKQQYRSVYRSGFSFNGIVSKTNCRLSVPSDIRYPRHVSTYRGSGGDEEGSVFDFDFLRFRSRPGPVRVLVGHGRSKRNMWDGERVGGGSGDATQEREWKGGKVRTGIGVEMG